MNISLTVRDEQTFRASEPPLELVLHFASPRITVRELIRERVYSEVQAYNDWQPQIFQGLVQPSGTEQLLNGYRMRSKRKIDPEAQLHQALDAFEANGFIVLVDDQQVESLETVIEILPETQVSFIKLTPLVGG